MNRFLQSHRLLSLVAAAMLIIPSAPMAAVETAAAVSAAQGIIKVKGVVVDGHGNPLIGAGVVEKGENNGTMTLMDGSFELQVNKGAVLEFSFIGCDNVEVKVSDDKPLRVVLTESTEFLDQVVVVAYGTQKKESVLGAITQISNDDIVNSGQTNITNALTGKLSGVTTINTNGQPGSNDADIFIRGVSSWNSSKPLVMVDGVERDFNDIDPNEVASISVLKDASATAVFGAKGANGVILVTTRTGSTSRPKMQATVSYGMDFPTHIPDQVNSATTAELLNIGYINTQSFGSMIPQKDINEYRNPSSKINAIRYPNNNWYDLMAKDFASTMNANLNISGGSERVKYFASLAYAHEGSFFKNFSNWNKADFTYDRMNYRLNLDFEVSKYTDIAIKVGGVLGIKANPTGVSVTKLFNYIYSASPMMYPAHFPAWVLEEIPDTDYPDASGERYSSSKTAYFGNPYPNLAKGSFEQVTSNKLYTDLVLNQDLSFILKGLSLKANASFSTYFSRISQTAEMAIPSFYIDWDRYDSGEGNPWIYASADQYVFEQDQYAVTRGAVENTYYVNFYWDASLNYDRSFGNHNVTALALFNQRQNIKTTNFPYHSQALVGRVTYDYNQTYLFEFNIGYTGSEQFAPQNRYGLFPAVAVGYIPSQELWWKSAMPWWSKLKLRYSDGLVGSDSGTRWLYVANYNKSNGLIYEGDAANVVAQWEEARKRDIGIEMSFLNHRLFMNLDLYDEQRTNMLVNPNVTMLVGTNFKEVNRGSLKKHGFDIELGWKDKLASGFRYNLTAMLSFNENRITNYEDAPYAPEYQKVAGKPYKGQTDGVSLVDGGYYTSVDDIHNYPAYSTNWQYVNVGSYKYLDYAADNKLNSQDLHAIEGSLYPPFIGSFNAGFSYKGFEFNMLWYANVGKYVEFNKSWEIEFNKGDYRVSASQLDYWRPDNQDANHATLVYGGSSGHPMYMWAGGSGDSGAAMMLEGRTWRKADYLALKEVYLGYRFNSKKLRKSVGIDNLNIYMTANNLLTFSDLIEGDPQSTTFTNGFYPNMLSVKLGVKVGF